MTPSEVADRIEEAVRVFRRMPSPRPSTRCVTWPAYPHDPSEAYGYGEERVRLGPPTPDQISRADQAADWVADLGRASDRSLVWAVAHRFPWRRIAVLMGCDHKTAKRRHTALMRIIANRVGEER